MDRPSWAPAGVNLDQPSVARMYDYYLGGMHNFEVDRRMADMGAQLWPNLPQIMRANRMFLNRAVRHLADQGVDQYLDVGSGIPTAGNVHQTAQKVDPQARVAYVDIDPVAVAHASALLAGNDRAVAISGDARDPDAILHHEQVRGLIDFDRPIAVLLVALLHFIPDSADPAGIIARFRQEMAPGSYLVLSHFSNEGTPEQVEGLLRLSSATATPMTMRSRAEITGLFDGFDLVEPGVVYLPQWRPEPNDDPETEPARFNDFCGVAVRP